MKQAPSHLLESIFRAILTANVYDVCIKTRLDRLGQLSEKTNHHIYLKREDLQPVFSFKCRGAYNKICHLMEAFPETKGIICASAGNHAQGVALSAKKLKVKATVVMPKITPKIKVDAVARFGGDYVKVVLHGNNFDEAANHAKAIQEEEELVFIHPFDDLDVIAGQGTVGKEIIEDLRYIDAIFVPAGGGGLIAGIGAYVKYLKPEVKIICVEHVESASMEASIQAGEHVVLPHVGVFADGVAVKRVGDKTFAIAKEVIDETITVTTDEICAAINQIFDEKRIVCEPSGAVALAGINKYIKANQQKDLKPQSLVGILSGANMNFDRLRHVTERNAFGAKTECLLGVRLEEKAGSFKGLCQAIENRAVTEFNYRCNNTQEAQVFIGVSVKDENESEEVVGKLKALSYDAVNLSDDDLSKLHLRYLVGGKLVQRELIYRIEFPECPGALFRFLDQIGEHNITLFHYRNHGSDHGRVLIGFSEPENGAEAIEENLKAIGYYFANENDNPAYQRFLAAY